MAEAGRHADAGGKPAHRLVAAWRGRRLDQRQGRAGARDPDLSAQAAIDNKLNTLWISEMFHGSDNLPAMNSDNENNHDLKFSQIYVNPPIGTSIPRWFEITIL